MKQNKLLVIIPAYNEAENIETVVNNLIENYPQYDYVIVNDGSSDATRKICKANGYNLMDLPTNVGLSGAIKAGMKYANFHGYDYAIQIDGDGQHDPAFIDSMLQCMISDEVDIVIGSRFVTEKKPLSMRMLGSRLISLAIAITAHKHIGDVTSGMRLYNKRMIKRFGYKMNYSPEPDTLAYLIRCGVKIKEVQVTMQERQGGVSYLSLGRSIEYMIRRLITILFFQWFRKKEAV